MSEKPNRAPAYIEPWIERLPQINQMRAEGRTGTEISALFSVTCSYYTQVLRWMSSHGYEVVDSPHSIHTQKDKGIALLARMEAIRALMMQGLPVGRMADKLRRSPAAIRNDINLGATSEDRLAWLQAKRHARSLGEYKVTASKKPISAAELRRVRKFLPLMVKGMTRSEIAAVLGCTINVVDNTISCGATPEQKAAWKKAREAREVAVSQGEK